MPTHDPALSRLIADATRGAVEDLRAEHPERFYAFALLTTGEALHPYLSACSHEDDERNGLPYRWGFSDSSYVVWGYEQHFIEVRRAFEDRGDLFRLPPAASAAEYATRLASMEEAWRLLDADGVFGTGEERERVLLVVETLPPDASAAEIARRLNPPGPLREAYLREAGEITTAPGRVSVWYGAFGDEDAFFDYVTFSYTDAAATNPFVRDVPIGSYDEDFAEGVFGDLPAAVDEVSYVESFRPDLDALLAGLPEGSDALYFVYDLDASALADHRGGRLHLGGVLAYTHD